MNREKKSLQLPARLRRGDRIGLVAPASPFERSAFDQGVRVLEGMGYVPCLAKGLFRKSRYLAGSDAARAEMVDGFIRDPRVRAIVCARGGYGAMRILPLLDYGAIRRNPKIIVGFSDITALLTACYSRSGLICFHGPMATTLGSATGNARKSLQRAVASAEKIRLAPRKAVAVRPGKASGRVFGGNLTTLCHLCGTGFAPDFKGHILILEDIAEAPYRLDRMLTQMKMAGSFEGLAGLALGSFKDCGRPREVYAVVSDIFRDQSFPILAGFDFGHVRNNPTLPIGLEATLDTGRGLLSYHAAATAERDR